MSCLSALSWQAGSTYQDRISTVLAGGRADSSVASRLDAQMVAVRTWANHPFGVGFTNFPEATAPEASSSVWFTAVGTSDSVYFDFLLAAGMVGLTLLICCFYLCWINAKQHHQLNGAMYLRAGMLGMIVAATATPSPASVYVAPFFFLLSGLATGFPFSGITTRYPLRRRPS